MFERVGPVLLSVLSLFTYMRSVSPPSIWVKGIVYGLKAQVPYYLLTSNRLLLPGWTST